MAEQRLMKYNPAFLSDEELIESFAVRERELSIVLEVIRENTGPSNQHMLVIGPRGIGKTTLVRRVAVEVRRDAGLKEAWAPLVYAEESYRVCTPGEFWLEGILHIAEQTKDPRWQKSYEELGGERDEQRLREKALSRLLDYADERGKRILLIVENLNMLFQDQMDKEAGWILRQTLQHEKRIMLLGTASQRFTEIAGIERAWFEMFKILELEPLSTNQGRKMWKSITGQQLSSARGKMMKILTGGNPRLLAILIQFAEKMSLKDLMDDLVRLVDEHTEYFKSHLDNLPGMERKVFTCLAEIWNPATASEVAAMARLEVSKTSAFLNRLIERGAVEVISSKGRKKTYQLVERMYNIYYLMRCRGAVSSRVRAVVRFMTSFYTNSDIGKVIGALGKEACLLPEGRGELYQVYECMLEAEETEEGKEGILKATPREFFMLPDAPERIRELGVQHIRKDFSRKIDEFFACMEKEDYRRLEDITSELIKGYSNSTAAWVLRGDACVINNKYEEAKEAYQKAIEIDPEYDLAWCQIGKLFHEQLNKYEEAKKAYRQAIAINPNIAGRWFMLGNLLKDKLKEFEEAEAAFRKVVDLKPNLDLGRAALIEILLQTGKSEQVMDEAERALDALGRDSDFLGKIAELFLLSESKNYLSQAEGWAREAVEKEPERAKYKFTLARILGGRGAWTEALGLMKAVMEDEELAKTHLEAVIEFYVAAGAMGYAKEGLKILSASASAIHYEPLVAGLEMYITGQRGLRAKEIEDVAEDVVERIRKRQKNTQ